MPPTILTPSPTTGGYGEFVHVQTTGATGIEKSDNAKDEVIPEVFNFWEHANAPYLIAISCALAIVILAIVLFCICRAWRRAKHLREENTRICVQSTIKPTIREGQTVQPDAGYSYSSCATSQPIKIKSTGLHERRSSGASLTIDLNQPVGTVRWMASPPRESSVAEYLESAGNRMTRKQLRNSVKNIRALHEEFWDIPDNHTDSIEVPGSAAKNRYPKILPNPSTRVVLPSIPNDTISDYINANYIRGYDREPMAFIATQGPMVHTFTDFWRMAWFSEAPIIVMVTKLKERNKNKCDKYWPPQQGIYGDIEVNVLEVNRNDDYILRILNLKYLEESRQMLHYWYTSWPDNKAPENPLTLLEMIKEVQISRADNSLPKGPVVVHCSAGLGRTGCYIGISVGMRQLEEEKMVDVLGIVCQMRQDRGGMIQTNEQYEFVHQALCMYEKRLPENGSTTD
ncbi:tyrosine-protein phosphatase non-receptor type 5-like isoform X3 [Asterias rubens]|uniref:tyrosine-protein phosphatase non-receptor type 5-like isoform X1 n=1 Tax=Asterias rubens TaxID=7604 RepID=UPI001455ACB5|nr:tyrosine-protein phosphatase non-receptor type 5-like isoform X1 [Asterias rubens]XP_033646233.1 tyrosine-protein phosphatase non-receptor type 5-like isoform X2 [Asterias rubens]XP_033646234.1 tyrosine-protein phosphatase non-receptor type 5-like isoform X3 [Asterias rubens]